MICMKDYRYRSLYKDGQMEKYLTDTIHTWRNELIDELERDEGDEMIKELKDRITD